MNHQSLVIIGSGLAGYAVARELRKLNTEIPITMLSADHGGFYSKPMLSNALATGKTPASILSSDAAMMASQLKITIRPFTRVNTIAHSSNTVFLENGENLSYSHLVLAVGADPIRLPLSGNAVEEVLSVNDLDDYHRFRETLKDKKEIAILGAGLIGCEFANDLAIAGYQVHVIHIGAHPLGRLLPEEAGKYLQDKLTAAGIRFHLKTKVQRIERIGNRYHLIIDEDQMIEADLVLSAVGLRPRTQLAKAAGIYVNHGVVTNRYLQTENTTENTNIFALGDCAEVDGKVLPFVMPITHAARALAATVAGTPTPVHYPPMPVFVKTPACPIVVSPPDPNVIGEWQIDANQDGVKALFQDMVGNLHGFALLGAATKEKNTITPQLPPILA
ncbi:NAD(P)/FAD-dependent oxidoreductase [Nitrosomonas sp. Is37]|uniref:NAD(P)/FAD-dependent oxidoreductase n=1 Tax=Nitrosomonas sp. Is37 TaxID=3080535 RepID=UPI00294B4251|nr:FAD-dependent oxidoreductase [Nitrosomonas sp. Is37]MDV6343686.1 FAD-dependent oxidoreductase [Nitrosomonas sp. Is37]